MCADSSSLRITAEQHPQHGFVQIKDPEVLMVSFTTFLGNCMVAQWRCTIRFAMLFVMTFLIPPLATTARLTSAELATRYVILLECQIP